MKKSHFILLTTVLLSFCHSKKESKNVSSHKQPPGSLLSIEAVPQGRVTINDSSWVFAFKKYFKDSMPDYKLPEPDQFTEGYEDFTKNKTPYLCAGDFNGDGLKDFAVLAIKGDSLYLLAFNRSGEGFKKHHLKTYKQNTSQIAVIIEVEKRRKWKGIDESIMVDNDGITVQLINESLTYSYYWDNGSYKRFLYD